MEQGVASGHHPLVTACQSVIRFRMKFAVLVAGEIVVEVSSARTSTADEFWQCGHCGAGIGLVGERAFMARSVHDPSIEFQPLISGR